MSSGLLGVLPRLRGVVPVGANDLSTAGTRWPVASKSAAEMTAAELDTFCWNAFPKTVLSWSAMSPGGGEPDHPVSGDQLDLLTVTLVLGADGWPTSIRTRCGSPASTFTATRL